MKTNVLPVPAALIAATVLTACTGQVDRDYVLDGPAGPTYQADLAQCRALSDTLDLDQVRDGRIVGGLAGAGLGALDADEGDELGNAVVGAAVGATIGGLEATAERDVQRREIVIRCLQGRGHRVVG